ncbi:MAG: deoxyribose-phosphate aldolase [Eubacteriales bacterium]|nr:deoxyribose-phosphate aldolase [Eubacteriales bacterium]
MTLNRHIDHTLLSPVAREAEIRRLCEEAKHYHFKSVCVNGVYTAFAAAMLKDTDVSVCTVIGFPLGQGASEAKASEAALAVRDGAAEVDMVMNIAKLKDKEDGYVLNDIRAVREAIGPETVLKVIIETALLTDGEKIRACKLAVDAGADYVKTSTGFNGGGATASDVRLMADTVGDRAKVKASGGIRNRRAAEEMIRAGADRIGASASVTIVSE